MAIDEGGVARRTIRVPDEEWAAAMAAASRNGETLSAVIRRAISAYAIGTAEGLADFGTEYRLTSKIALGDGPVVISGVTGEIDTVRQLYPPAKWDIEERDVSPYRASMRRR
ncbi:hypothetical protein [Nocardia sp. NPDC058480]|uniref:hypothetical protein n=1 Tax=unclassified Nocardia TaxID=2637762 RepID=UPI003646BB36